MRIRYWLAGLAAAMAVMLVAACGASSGAASRPSANASAASSTPAAIGRPPAEAVLVSRVKSAVRNARSVHVAAALTQGRTSVGINASLTRSNDFFGNISLKNQHFTLLAAHGHQYAKFTAGSGLKAMGIPPAACVLMCGKYIKMPASVLKGFAGGLDWSSLVGHLSQVPTPLRYLRTVTVNGQPSWEMKWSGGTAYLAAQGPPYPLKLARGPNQIDYTQWNSASIPPLPPASQVIDPSQFKNAG